MKRHKLILIVAGLGCAGLLVVILAGGIGRESAPLTGSSAPPNASISFLGFTNIPGKGQYARFCFTNESTRSIAVTVDSFDESVAGHWVNRRLATNLGNNNIQFINGGARWLKGFMGFQNSLAARASFVFCAPAPSFVGWQDLGPDEQASVYIPSPVWRMSFLCQARESKDGFREFFGRATPNSIVLPNAPNARPRLQIFSGARVSVLSPEVTP